jgi:hypothetical protein
MEPGNLQKCASGDISLFELVASKIQSAQAITPPHNWKMSDFGQLTNALHHEYCNCESLNELSKHSTTCVHGIETSVLNFTPIRSNDQVLEVSDPEAAKEHEFKPLSNISTQFLSELIKPKSAPIEDEKWAYSQGRQFYMKWKVKQANIAHEADVKAVKEVEWAAIKKSKAAKSAVDSSTFAHLGRLDRSTSTRVLSQPSYSRQQPTPSPETEDLDKSSLQIDTNGHHKPSVDLDCSGKMEQNLVSPSISDELNPLSSHTPFGSNTDTEGLKPCDTPEIPIRYVDLTLAEYQKQYDLPRRNSLPHKQRMELAADHSVVFMANALREAELIPHPAAFEKALSVVIMKFYNQNPSVNRKRQRSSIDCATRSTGQCSMGNSVAMHLSASTSSKRTKTSSAKFQ